MPCDQKGDKKRTSPGALGVLHTWDRFSQPSVPPASLSSLSGEVRKTGFLLQGEGAAQAAASGASSDSSGWGVFMSSRNDCKSGTSVHLWPGHPLPYQSLP